MACNDFGGPTHTPEQVRGALDLPPEVPLLFCDARSRESSKHVLISLVEHLRHLQRARHPQTALQPPIPEPTP